MSRKTVTRFLFADERLRNFRNVSDPHFVSLYYQFGRYLLICSSQPGGQPANLQGIWNGRRIRALEILCKGNIFRKIYEFLMKCPGVKVLSQKCMTCCLLDDYMTACSIGFRL